jgi:hypothetical protein
MVFDMAVALFLLEGCFSTKIGFELDFGIF